MLAGPERSVAATKTYLASLHAVAQISACLSPDGESAIREWWERLPDLLGAAVQDQLASRTRFDPLDEASMITAVGRGLQFSTAHETALKLRELSGIAAEAFSLPDLVHGPIAGLRAAGAIWVISGAARQRPDARTLQTLRDQVGMAVAVSDDAAMLAAADIQVKLPPGLPAWVAPMLAVIPAQAAALRLGELRGVDVDHPHGLHKITLTR
jgi:glucosamine--fructose-6-phosphate aminotransferase (isomerizing)